MIVLAQRLAWSWKRCSWLPCFDLCWLFPSGHHRDRRCSLQCSVAKMNEQKWHGTLPKITKKAGVVSAERVSQLGAACVLLGPGSDTGLHTGDLFGSHLPRKLRPATKRTPWPTWVKALGIGDFPVRMMNEQDEELMSGTTKKSSKKTSKQRKRESAAAAEEAPQGVLARHVIRHSCVCIESKWQWSILYGKGVENSHGDTKEFTMQHHGRHEWKLWGLATFRLEWWMNKMKNWWVGQQRKPRRRRGSSAKGRALLLLRRHLCKRPPTQSSLPMIRMGTTASCSTGTSTCQRSLPRRHTPCYQAFVCALKASGNDQLWKGVDNSHGDTKEFTMLTPWPTWVKALRIGDFPVRMMNE